MGNEANKLTQYLDMFSPFLESLPAWLRIWIYILIFLICMTLAAVCISYLMSKERRMAESSLRYFTVENPRDHDEIPLGETHSWILEGNFPIIHDHESSMNGGISVEVFKTAPVRKEVEQHGRVRISTVDGRWSFESAYFPEDGMYEIIVTATLNGESVYRRLNVNCVQKATAYKNYIAENKRLRGIEGFRFANREAVSIVDLKKRLYEMQRDFFDHYPQDVHEALNIVSQALDLVDSVLPLYPDDLYLQNIRAYMLKNYAMVMKQMGRQLESIRALDESARMFEAIREQQPENAGAWNGLGSISLLRGEPRKALAYIERALEIDPHYEDALHDKRLALEMIRNEDQGEK